ncbi:MAG TPA: TetR/AcrR family transcriptional regulator [Mycobacterium sp.]|nr:TetR/AcrR family transcriptional regulator [Mycobacterium sp.]
MARAETATERTRAVILDAAARVLGRRPDAAMADIADEAGVGRATLYRHFPTRESLLDGVADAGEAELADGFAAANLEALAVDRAIARLTSVFLRTGAKYAALLSQVKEHHDPVAKARVIQPVRDVIARGVRDGVLRADLPGDTLFEMFTALVERALWLTVSEAVTPEEGADAVVTMFLDGARRGTS